MRLAAPLFIAASLLACSKPDPWAPCRASGPPGFRADPPSCTSPGCRACVDVMERVWRSRSDPAQEGAFRARFMRISADARDAFSTRVHPDGTYPYEHCTALTAPGASCAQYSPYCVDVIAQALRSGSTSLANRGQYTLASTRACDASRDAIVTSLTARCEGVPAGQRCDGAECASCVAGHLAAMSVLAPQADQEQGAAAMRAVIDATPEAVARAIAETLGAPDAPSDLETVVVQRSLRLYCFSLVGHSASPPPYACNAVMTRFLTHSEYPDSSKAWEALAAARTGVRSGLLDALLVDVGRETTIATKVLAALRGLPRDETLTAITRAMQSPTMTDGAYASLRDLLVGVGVTGAALPPVNRPSTPAAPSSVPSNGASPRAPVAPSGLRAPGAIPARQG